MKIISWNVNGLRSSLKQGFLAWLKLEQPDILCLQEIKADESQIPLSDFEALGYSHYICPAEKRGYSGTLILSKIKARKINCRLGLARFDREGRMVEADFGRFSIINFYLPHGGRQKENLKYKLDCYRTLINYCRGRKNLVLAGDFNIARSELDLARPKQNQNNIMFTAEERSIFNELLESGFSDSFRLLHPETAGAYTWWPYLASARARNIGWRIDYILLSGDLASAIVKAEPKPDVLGSDHCPFEIDINWKEESK